MTDLTVEDDQSGAIDSLRERFAAQAHEAWSGWMRHLFHHGAVSVTSRGEVIIPGEYAASLRRQMNTPYAELSEAEKESDRAEADKYLAIQKKYLEEMAGRFPKRYTIELRDAVTEELMGTETWVRGEDGYYLENAGGRYFLPEVNHEQG